MQNNLKCFKRSPPMSIEVINVVPELAEKDKDSKVITTTMV